MSKLEKEDLIDIMIYNYFEKNDDNALKELLNNGISKDRIIERYNWLKNMNIDPNNIHLKENHKIIYLIFDKLNKMLNDNHIEYYYTSGILSYSLVNKELERYHHDLDIFINMNSLELLEKICSNYNFKLERKMGPRGDGTDRVMLKLYYGDYIDIPITIFMYVREEDMSITQNDYYVDKNEFKLEKTYNSPKVVEYSFSNNKYYHNNIEYHSITLEALYLSKLGNRPKDIYDCNVFKDYVNYEKLKELKKAFLVNKKNEVFDAKEDTYYEFIFRDLFQKERMLKNDRL